jgi:hypothetical protein
MGGGDTSWLRQRFHTDEGQLFAADPATQAAMVKKAVDFGLERDVLPLKPTVVTVDFGMNDHYYQAFRPDILRAYLASQTEIARVLDDHGSRVAFVTPQPIEDKRPDPDQDIRNISLRKFSEALRDLAPHEKALFADEFDPYMQTMQRSASSTVGGGRDAVHPGPPGHTIMAWAILKSLGATPLVSSATIDKPNAKVGDSERCQVSNLSVNGDTVSFDRLDEALPMPVDPKAESVLALIPFSHDLNDYELKVTGLAHGDYSVSIDGAVAATVSADDLAKGWNLAYTAGPITEQAQRLLKLVFKKNDLYFNRWRMVELYSAPIWVSQGSDLESRRTGEMARLDAEIQGVEARINAERTPKLRHFAIAPVAPGAE